MIESVLVCFTFFQRGGHATLVFSAILSSKDVMLIVVMFDSNYYAISLMGFKNVVHLINIQSLCRLGKGG